MKIETTAIDGVLIVTPTRHEDPRGFFSEVFREDRFQAAAGPVHFVQDNHSASAITGTLRGLHLQRAPRGQAKLVRVVRGAILDVAVDVRTASPTYGQHVAVTLSAENWRQLFIPVGFLHGFCTLSPDTEVAYKVSDYYSAEHDLSIRFDDPALGIAWPQALDPATLSAKDRAALRLSAHGPLF